MVKKSRNRCYRGGMRSNKTKRVNYTIGRLSDKKSKKKIIKQLTHFHIERVGTNTHLTSDRYSSIKKMETILNTIKSNIEKLKNDDPEKETLKEMHQLYYDNLKKRKQYEKMVQLVLQKQGNCPVEYPGSYQRNSLMGLKKKKKCTKKKKL
jgi:hypothetical protein